MVPPEPPSTIRVASRGALRRWLGEPDASPPRKSVEAPDDADAVAYVLYTSGSTGTPKGVVHTHRNAMAFVLWSLETFAPGPDDRVSSHAPFHFDLSIFDLYVPAACGAAVVLIGAEQGKEPLGLASLVAER